MLYCRIGQLLQPGAINWYMAIDSEQNDKGKAAKPAALWYASQEVEIDPLNGFHCE